MLKHFFSKRLLRYFAAAASLLMPVVASAQAKPQLAGVKIDAKDRVELTHSIPGPMLTATDLGRASTNLPMKDMFLLLQPTADQKKALETFLSDVQNPTSPKYHQWLTPAQFGESYGPAQSDVDTVTQWLTNQGFTVEQVATSRAWIRFSGTAATVENTFNTQIHNYRIEGKTVYSNSAEVTLPRVLSSVVSSVLSLNNYEKHTLHTAPRSVTRSANGKLVAAARTATASQLGTSDSFTNAILAKPSFTSQNEPEENLLAPGDFSKIYDTSALIAKGTDGSGVSIAIVGRSDISLSDVEAFRTIFGLPFNDPTIINANTDPGVIPGDDEEAILDVEWSGAVAPHAQIKYVVGGTTTTTDGVDISAAYIVDNRTAPIMSISFGLCEQAVAPAEQQFYYTLFQQASAEGISVLVASDDAGASACVVPSEYLATTYGLGVSGLASTPYATAVGGTEFADTVPGSYWTDTINADQSSAKGYIPEAVWNESCNVDAPVSIYNCYFDPTNESTYASGGGASSCSTHSSTPSRLTGLYSCTSGYEKPSWQTGNGVPNDAARDVPDIAMAAAGGHDGFMLCYDGSCQYTTNSDGSITLQGASIIGGTSAATPSMAGVMALVEQKNGQYQGLLNPIFYALAAQQTASCDSSAQTDPTQGSSCVFHDVTSGSNTLTCLGTASGCTGTIPGSSFKQLSGWAAGAGYDLSTGLGSVDVANLVTAWGNLKQAATSTSLTLSSTTFTHGTAVNVTETTAPTSGSGMPTGTVVLMAAGNTSNPGPVLANDLTSGSYTGSIANLPGGTYQLTAQYGGDASFASSTSSPVTVTIASEPTVIIAKTMVQSTYFVLGQIPIIAGSSTGLNSTYYLSIQLAGQSGAGIPSGNVTITQGANNTPVGTFPIDKTGLAYIPCGPGTPCDYPIGNYTFNASYSGDSSFQAAATTIPFSITKGKAKWSVSASAQVVPTNATVVATVFFGYDPAVLPTGTVTLYRDDTGATLGTAPIGSDGSAVITFNAPAGSYGAQATWSGDSNYFAAYDVSWPSMTVTDAGGSTSTTALTVANTSSTLGLSTSFAVTVSPASGTKAQPTGTVTLYSQEYGQISNNVNLVGGSTAIFVKWPYAGSLHVYAVYSGDTTFAGSNSAMTLMNVGKATPAITLASLAPYVAVKGQGSITASVVSALASSNVSTPTGTIQFYDSVNGSPAAVIGTAQALNAGNGGSIVATIAPILAAGTHSLTAIYSGDANWNTAFSSAAVTITATAPDFSVAAPSTVSVTAGQTASIALTTSSLLGYSIPAVVSCTGTLPPGISCGKATIVPGALGTLSITTTAPGIGTVASASHPGLPWQMPGAIAAAGLLLIVLPRRRRFASLAVLVLGAVLASVTMTGCSNNGNPSATSVTLASSSTKVASGSTVTLTASVAGSRNPTGTVTFSDGSTALGTATVSNGVASFQTAQLAVGTHAITASYSGDTNNDAAKSSEAVEQSITGTFNLSIAALSGSLTHTLTVPVTLQ